MPNRYGQETRAELLKRKTLNMLRDEYHNACVCPLCGRETVEERIERRHDNDRPCEVCGETSNS